MKHKNSHLLVGYWSRLRKGRDVPDQTDIDPRAIKRLLSYTFILDCENPGPPAFTVLPAPRCASVSALNSRAPAFWPIGNPNPACRWPRCCARR